MTRDEAKVLMRLELEQDLLANEREQKIFPIRDRMMSANDLMAEVEAGTRLGNYLLDDFIAFKNNGLDEPLSTEKRAEVIKLMEKDIESPGWLG
jgi:hypothetical protein